VAHAEEGFSLLMDPDFHEENESASHCMAMG
jgi:hypothetical protein